MSFFIPRKTSRRQMLRSLMGGGSSVLLPQLGPGGGGTGRPAPRPAAGGGV